MSEGALERPPVSTVESQSFLKQRDARTMLCLYFSGGPGGETETIGPAPWFRISGNYIRMGPHGTISGTFHMHHWEVNGHHYPRYDCKEPVLIHFEDVAGGPTPDFGPFSSLYAQDGLLHAGRALFAKFIEETVLWHCFVSETYWPVLVIKSVPGTMKA
jgi:hypothetical protein